MSAAKKPLAEEILTRVQLATLPQPEPLIEGTIDRRNVVVLAGRSGTAKTFIGLDWACSVATAKSWQGRKVLDPGPVLVIAAEGAYTFDNRVTAWESAWSRQVTDLYVLPFAINLFSGERFDELQEHVRTARYRLVIIDTWARSTVGGRENDNSDSTIAFERLDALRHLDVCVVVIAHTDKGDNSTRGASALEDNADTVYRMKSDEGQLTLARTKRKNGPCEDELHLQLKPFLDSVVIESATGQDQQLKGQTNALMSVFTENFSDTGCDMVELRHTSKLKPATFDRCLKNLVNKGLLKDNGENTQPRYTLGRRP
jgi:hypothetical protein